MAREKLKKLQDDAPSSGRSAATRSDEAEDCSSFWSKDYSSFWSNKTTVGERGWVGK